MNSDTGDSTGRRGPDPENDQPINILMEHEQETASDFVARVRRKIDRRTSASHLASYTWHLPKMVFIELAAMLNHILMTLGGKKES